MCHLVLYFPKIYHSGEEGALITFVYIQIRHPSHSSPSVFVQHFWRPRLLWLGVNRTGQRLKTTPARFFFRCGLSFFRGGRAGGAFFLKITITHLICRLAPFWEHRGRGGRELAPSRQILESNLQIELLKYYCRLMKYGDCTVNRWY